MSIPLYSDVLDNSQPGIHYAEPVTAGQGGDEPSVHGNADILASLDHVAMQAGAGVQGVVRTARPNVIGYAVGAAFLWWLFSD